MPRSFETQARPGPIRAEILDLMARAGGPERVARGPEEAEFVAALREIINRGRTPADALRDKYSADRGDARGRIFDRYRD